MRIICTKNISGELLDQMKRYGWKVECMPTIRLHQVEFSLSGFKAEAHAAIVFTSEMAVKSFCSKKEYIPFLETKRIYSTNGATLNALKLAGIFPEFTGSNAVEIGKQIVESGFVKSVLHICGNLALPVLRETLGEHGILYSQLIVYKNYPEYIPALQSGYDAVLFYSPSGIDGFRHNNPLRNDVVYCCVGATSAAYLNTLSAGLKCIVSKENSTEGMTRELYKFYQTNQ